MRGATWLVGCVAAFVLVASASCKKDAATPADDTSASSSSSGGGDGGDGTLSSSSGTSGNSSSGNPDGDASTSSGNPPPPKPTVETNETMPFEGVTRHYVLGKPKDYDAAKAYPVVMSFHGDGGSGGGQAGGLPFDSASQNEAILVYPSGNGGSWNLYSSDNPDIRWIKALINEVATKVNIDKAKVFGWGYSNGSYFLAQLTCREANVFKAISSSAGGGPNDDFGELEQIGIGRRPSFCLDCPAGPIPALIIHGSNDNPAGGEFTARCIAETNGCDNNRAASTPTPCEQYNGCPAGNPVKWCEIPNFGHGVWNQAMSESWKFFKAL